MTGGAYLGSSTVRPSQLAGPASSRPSPSPSSVVFVPTEGGECGRRARATAPRHLSPCLPALPLLASMPLDDAMPPPCSLSLSPGSSLLSLALSLSHGRTPPSPPFAVAAISGHPSLPRLAQKLRHDPLFLPTAPRSSRSPASPPRRRSSLRAPTIVAVEFAVSSASPSPLRRPLQPR